MEKNFINEVIKDISISCHLRYIERRIKPPGIFVASNNNYSIDYILRHSRFIDYKYNLYIPNNYKGYKIRLVDIER